METIPEDFEFRVAVRMLNQDPPLEREILEALVGNRMRYSELRPLLQGRNDNELTRALKRLREDGLLQTGLTRDLDERTYGLTSLGKVALFRLHEMIPHHLSIEAYRRGLAPA